MSTASRRPSVAAADAPQTVRGSGASIDPLAAGRATRLERCRIRFERKSPAVAEGVEAEPPQPRPRFRGGRRESAGRDGLRPVSTVRLRCRVPSPGR